MVMNVCLSPIKVHFRPLPEFTISPQWFANKIINLNEEIEEGENEKGPTRRAALVCGFMRGAALFGSYVISPNIQIPLQVCGLLLRASSSSVSGTEKIINVIFSAAILGIISKYSYDGTLRKLSNDFYSLTQESKSLLNRLKQGNIRVVTTYEPPQMQDNPEQMSCIRSIISCINSVIKAIFNFFFYCFEKITGLCSEKYQSHEIKS